MDLIDGEKKEEVIDMGLGQNRHLTLHIKP